MTELDDDFVIEAVLDPISSINSFQIQIMSRRSSLTDDYVNTAAAEQQESVVKDDSKTSQRSLGSSEVDIDSKPILGRMDDSHRNLSRSRKIDKNTAAESQRRSITFDPETSIPPTITKSIGISSGKSGKNRESLSRMKSSSNRNQSLLSTKKRTNADILGLTKFTIATNGSPQLLRTPLEYFTEKERPDSSSILSTKSSLTHSVKSAFGTSAKLPSLVSPPSSRPGTNSGSRPGSGNNSFVSTTGSSSSSRHNSFVGFTTPSPLSSRPAAGSNDTGSSRSSLVGTMIQRPGTTSSIEEHRRSVTQRRSTSGGTSLMYLDAISPLVEQPDSEKEDDVSISAKNNVPFEEDQTEMPPRTSSGTNTRNSTRHHPKLHQQEFSTSAPCIRSYYSVFADVAQTSEEERPYTRSQMRTPREIIARIEAKNRKRERRQRRRNKVKDTADHDDLDDIHSIPTLTPAGEEGPPKFLSLSMKRASVRDQSTKSLSNAKSGKSMSAEAATFDPFDGTRGKYFGVEAKLEFSAMFRDVPRQVIYYPTEDDLPEENKTPRTLYLRQIHSHDLLPLPLLMRKENAPYEINLKNRGLGDARVAPIVEIIDRLPVIHSINLCDNRLTDETLMPLALKLSSFKHLTFLDLSFNKMDDSSETIIEYLQSDECTLISLLLNGADVDDDEAGNLMEAFASNKSVTTLGLAHNKIGENEILNTVKPDVTTGGEAIAEMLMKNTTLTKLDLSWNAIRLESATTLGQAFESNMTLKSLNLAYNAMGDMGTQVLGRALRKNKGLEEIDLTSNSVMPKSAAVLAHSLCYNETLCTLILDGNVLGKVGAQSLVAKMQRAVSNVHRLRMSFKNCDCVKEDPCLFNAATPGGTYTVDLSEPYGQMVIEEAFFLGNYRSGCNITKFEYDGEIVELIRAEKKGEQKFDPKKYKKLCKDASKELTNKERCNFRSVDRNFVDIMAMFDLKCDEELRLEVLRKVHERWHSPIESGRVEELHDVLLYEVFAALFIVSDEDQSGDVDVDEFMGCLTKLNKNEIQREYAKILMDEFDVDGSGTINADEFSMIMVNQFCKMDKPKNHIVEKYSKMAWRIPREGKCTVDISYESEIPSRFNVGQDAGLREVLQTMTEAKTDDERDAIFKQATHSPYFYFTAVQAQLFLESCVHDMKMDRLPSIASILPQVVNAEEAVKFLDQNVSDDEKLVLRISLGPLYNIYTGVYTGHYCWDLRNPEHVRAGKSLACIASAETKLKKQLGSNTSQTGDFSTFRNARLGSMYIQMKGDWFLTCPSSGTLHMDYISVTKPPVGTKPINGARFEKMLEKFGLTEIPAEYKRLTNINFVKLREERMEAHRLAMISQQASRRGSNAHPVSRSSAMNSRRNSAQPAPLSPSGKSSAKGGAAGSTMMSHSSSSTKLESFAEDEVEKLDTNLLAISLMALNSSQKSDSQSTDRSGLGSSGRSFAPSEAGTRKGSMLDFSGSPQKATVRSMVTSSLMTKHKRSFVKPAPKPIEKPMSVLLCKEFIAEWIDTCHHWHDPFPVEKQRDMSRPTYLANLEEGQRPPTPERLKRAPAPSRNQHDEIFPFCLKILLILQVQLPSIYLSVQQVITILALFPPSTDYLRVMVVHSVFSRIVDLENFYQVLDADLFTPDETEELYHRIGILNACDPFNPDRKFRLDLRRWEHREWCKILVQLAMTEPGENWVDATYSWSRYDDHVPGWVLPESWSIPDEEGGGGGGGGEFKQELGPRHYGWLVVTYRSKGYGCKADPIIRKALRKRCLVGIKRLI